MGSLNPAKIPEEGNSNSLQYFALEELWTEEPRATVHRITKEA